MNASMETHPAGFDKTATEGVARSRSAALRKMLLRATGFSGIWGSGLTISAQFGVRDNNEASWTQVVDMLEFMADASDLPILLDGDTGYGNFNNMRRLVRKLEQP